MTVEIAEPIRHLAVPVGELNVWPGNPRRGDMTRLRASLRRFGQVRPILVQATTQRIIAGNHTYTAAVAEGATEIAVVMLDVDDDTARAYLIADNRLADVATNDDAALVAILEDLQQMPEGLIGTGYDDGDVAALLASLSRVDVEAEEAESTDMPERWAVLVTVDDDDAQTALMERLIAEGYECQAIIS